MFRLDQIETSEQVKRSLNAFSFYILTNFYALVLMMAPYNVEQLKISYLRDELGYQLTGNAGMINATESGTEKQKLILIDRLLQLCIIA